MSIEYHVGDLPADVDLGGIVAIDTETLGLDPRRDRLCVVQMSAGDGHCHVVHFPTPHYEAPHLLRMLNDPNVLKLFHFARFDLAVLRNYLGADCRPVYCTKVASKIARTYTDRHGLKHLCHELLGIDLSKQMQSSDWGAPRLSQAQLDYASHDVLHLHALRERLEEMLEREQRHHLLQPCLDFLPHRAILDLAGWSSTDIFAHS
ncbi:MAG: ribonuclease H-like domain-containing protein [Pseudomonadota bacterium]